MTALRRRLAGALLTLVAAAGCVGVPDGEPASIVTASSSPLPAATPTDEAGPPWSPPETADHARVVRVVDGDTVVLDLDGDDVRVRLLRIDTPELARDGDPAECLADAATDHLAALAPPGTALRLANDVEELDQYGRLLAHLWRADDGMWLNGAMLEDGYARVVTFPPNVEWTDEVLELQDEARRDARGLWGRCP